MKWIEQRAHGALRREMGRTGIQETIRMMQKKERETKLLQILRKSIIKEDTARKVRQAPLMSEGVGS